MCVVIIADIGSQWHIYRCTQKKWVKSRNCCTNRDTLPFACAFLFIFKWYDVLDSSQWWKLLHFPFNAMAIAMHFCLLILQLIVRHFKWRTPNITLDDERFSFDLLQSTIHFQMCKLLFAYIFAILMLMESLKLKLCYRHWVEPLGRSRCRWWWRQQRQQRLWLTTTHGKMERRLCCAATDFHFVWWNAHKRLHDHSDWIKC